MSKMIKELETIRKAKYKVKNAEGKYEVVYLETSADQVEQTADRVFVTTEEKAKITSNENAIAAETQARTEADNAIKARLDVIEGLDSQEGSINKALKDAKAYTDEKVLEVNGANAALEKRVETLETDAALVDGKISTAKTEAIDAAALDATSKVDAAKLELQGNIDTLSEKVTTNTEEISKLKDAVSNKNNNTIVVNTEAEIATANSTPKVGDLAFVITSKRAYIYKGLGALTVKSVPEGWVVFDEITNELDLVDYLKKTDAESTYRKLADKIAEVDLATELAQKINSKVDATYVTGEIQTAKEELNTSITANTSAIEKEVSDRKGEITRVEGLVTTVDGKVDQMNTTLTNRLEKYASTVSSQEPVGTEAGHVWLEIQE